MCNITSKFYRLGQRPRNGEGMWTWRHLFTSCPQNYIRIKLNISRLNDKVYLILIAYPGKNNHIVEYLQLPMRLRNSRPTIIIMSRVKVWKCPPREAAVAPRLLSAKHCKIQADEIVRPQCHKIPWVLQWDPAWRHGIGIWRGFVIPQRKDHRASGVQGKGGMDSIQRRNAHARN